MNIIRKETTSEGKEELKADVVPAVLTAESVDETVHMKPGRFGRRSDDGFFCLSFPLSQCCRMKYR